MNTEWHIYNDLWQESLKEFQNGRYVLDSLIHSADDTRRGITLLSRIPGKAAAGIVNFLDEARRIEPNQYYYPQSDFHLTILSIITCYKGFLLTDIQPDEYIRIISDCMDSIGKIKIDLKGITASSSCVMVQGFPQDHQLNSLRESLRNRFKGSTLPHSIDTRYSIRTAHSTVIRFQNPIQDSSRFLELLDKYRNVSFGTLEIEELELVFNDWYQRKEHTKHLHRFKLSHVDN